jgi:predicted nucleic acid-binding protein
LFHFKRPSTAPIGRLLDSGEAVCFACPSTLEELGHVVPREHFGLTAQDALEVVLRYRNLSLCVSEPALNQTLALPQCKDSADQKFLRLAISVGAEYLLTRDKALLKLARRMTRISTLKVTTPERFLEQFALDYPTISSQIASSICPPSA